METQRMISVSDAARILDLTERHVRRLCMEGKIDAEKEGKAYLVSFESALAFKDSGQAVDDPDMEDDNDAMSGHESSDAHTSNGHPANGNGHSPNENGHVRIETEMSANDSNGFLDLEEEHLFNRIEELKRTLDNQLAGHQESVSQIKGVLSNLAEGFTEERGKTRKTQNTLSSLLDDLEQPIP
jgi:hypothetical protein